MGIKKVEAPVRPGRKGGEMEFPHCPICWMPYAISPDGVGGWTTRKICPCPEPPPIQITYSNGTKPNDT